MCAKRYTLVVILVVDNQNQNPRSVAPSEFSQHNVWERKHIQEWVAKFPGILGEELLIVSLEFDRFDRTSERLDALAVDRSGNLVVIEFKRTLDGGSAELQALRYAAMVSSMRLDQLVPYLSAHIVSKLGRQVTDEESRQELLSFIDDPDFQELSDRPRIILCSQDFGPELTTTVLWLREFGLDISCVRITPHQVDENLIIVPTMIIPLPEAESYMVKIKEKQDATRGERSTRKHLTFPNLIRQGLLKEGDILFLSENLPSYVHASEADERLMAEVTGKLKADALRWKIDGQTYSVSGLAWKILSMFHPDGAVPGGVNGNVYWAKERGVCLWELDQRTKSPSALDP